MTPSEDPREREREFRQLIEDAVLAHRASTPSRNARKVTGRLGTVALALTSRWAVVAIFFLLLGGFFFGLFGWGIKLTDAYDCSIAEARRSPVVISELGEPIEPGFFAWSFFYRQEGSVQDTSFSTVLKGPKGEGTLRVSWYRAPVGSSLRMGLERNGTSQAIYNGPITCR